MITPNLSLDFTAATLDARITFTRTGATATRVNSSGYIEVVAADTARFDFSPVSLACKGLLVEETRQNLVLNSGAAPWGFTNVYGDTIVADAGTAPDNTVTADQISPRVNASSRLDRSITLTSGVQYTVSVFSRYSTGAAIVPFSLQNLANATVNQNFTVAETYKDGWIRSVAKFTPTATNVTVRIYWTSFSSGTFLVWGLQLEQGTFQTSYIPTTSTVVTRNADVAAITGTNFSDWWQSNKGGILVRARPGTVSGTRPWVQFDDGTANEIITLRGNTTNPELYIVDGGVDQAQIDAGTIAANTVYQFAGGWKLNECAASINGGNSVLDGEATMPTVTQARIGSDGTNYLNGHVETIEYYNRKPTNETLQQLTSSAGRFSVLSPILRQVVQS